MTIKTGNSKSGLYDFNGGLQFLLQSVDVNDIGLISRRAVELHAFQLSLYYPYLTQLRINDISPHKVDMIALGRKYAALRLYNYYASRALYKNTVDIGLKRVPSLNNIQTGLTRNFEPIEVLLELLKDYLPVEKQGPRVLEKDIAQDEFEKKLQHQFEKSRAVAELIKGYVTNGDELPKTLGRPIGSKIMREALRRAKIVKLSEKTLLKYFNELEATAVFHYLTRIHHCRPVLDPLYHYGKDFPQKAMQRAHAVDELRDVCLMYNSAVAELNEKYRFNFSFIENVPKSETETDYDALIHQKRNSKLTEAIKTVTGHTA
jgi:hypothetical protein